MLCFVVLFSGDILEEMEDVQVEGESVMTASVARGPDTTYHTHLEALGTKEVVKLSSAEINEKRCEVELQLSAWREVSNYFSKVIYLLLQNVAIVLL